METDWLLLTYRLPPEPSRKRVSVWRQLRKLGALHLEGGAWLLPYTEPLAAAVKELAAEIENLGGTVAAFLSVSLDGEQEENLRARVNEAREDEYRDVLRECDKMLAHVERETREGHFEFLEVEEMEGDLEKIQRWFDQVQQRDAFGVPLRDQVEQRIRECRERLARFTHEAYERGDQSHNA